MQVRIAIMVILCFILLAILRKDTFFASSDETTDVIVYGSHLPNLNTWLPQTWTARNTGSAGMEIVLTHFATNNVPSQKVTENHESVLIALDPYLYELKWKKLAFPVVAQGPSGYFVALSSPSTAFKTECSYNLYGKKIAYMTESEKLLIQAILHSYRIPSTSVQLIAITQKDVLDLPKMLDTKFDVFITYVIPNSLYFSMLRSLPVSLMGWQKIDMDRLRIYHPFVAKTTNIDIKSTFASPSPRSLIMVMDREKDSHLLEMKLNLYLAYGKKPVLSSKETFITRLAYDQELEDPAFQCYGDLTIANKEVCNSAYDVSGMPKARKTTWDRPCFQDEECPFFKANKNYPNSRGGCIRGRCELPIGVYRKSYRHFVDELPYTPICYQCKDPSNANCCEDQKDREKYEDLKSPDYAFRNDKNDRIQAKLPYFVSI